MDRDDVRGLGCIILSIKNTDFRKLTKAALCDNLCDTLSECLGNRTGDVQNVSVNLIEDDAMHTFPLLIHIEYQGSHIVPGQGKVRE